MAPPLPRDPRSDPDPLHTRCSFSHGGRDLEGATQGSPIPPPGLGLCSRDGTHLSWEASQTWARCARPALWQPDVVRLEQARAGPAPGKQGP